MFTPLRLLWVIFSDWIFWDAFLVHVIKVALCSFISGDQMHHAYDASKITDLKPSTADYCRWQFAIPWLTATTSPVRLYRTPCHSEFQRHCCQNILVKWTHKAKKDAAFTTNIFWVSYRKQFPCIQRTVWCDPFYMIIILVLTLFCSDRSSYKIVKWLVNRVQSKRLDKN